MPEEGVDLGPQRIRVFISGNSGNKEVRQWHFFKQGGGVEITSFEVPGKCHLMILSKICLRWLRPSAYIKVDLKNYFCFGWLNWKWLVILPIRLAYRCQAVQGGLQNGALTEQFDNLKSSHSGPCRGTNWGPKLHSKREFFEP